MLGIIMTRKGVTWFGLIVNVLLTVGKILAGILFSSQTILADGLHSGSDLVTDFAVLLGLRVSDRPADQNHHYGHHRVSSLVALFVGAALLGAAAWIAYEAIITLKVPDKAVHSLVPLSMAILSIVLKELLYQLTRIVGQRNRDASLIANAWHHRSDAFSSIAAAAGLAGVYFGGPDWAFLDHLTAAILAAFLAVVAVKIVYSSAADLLDQAPDPAMLASIADVVASTHGVISYHAFRARQIGGRVHMDIHIQVNPDLTVREGHDIATMVEKRVMSTSGDIVEVIVHIEPIE